MRILLTNNRLDVRGGAETFLCDLARDLQADGHSVMVFGSDLGAQERLFEIDRVPVVTDLEKLPFQPDVIHGQHHLDTMNAVLSLPGVPAIYHCHGATWKEAVPRHPRIYRYVAVSPTLAERIKAESNLPDDRVVVALNSVNLGRFHSVREPTQVPRKALFYNSYHHPDSATLAAIREAAASSDLSLDIVSQHFNSNVSDPERILPEYDLVFASGRSAIDAIASGCAVVTLGREVCGKLVTMDNYEAARMANFSMAGNAAPSTAGDILRQIEQYSADDCAKVTRRLREDADAKLVAALLLETYQQAIANHASAEVDLEGEMKAVARYFRRIVPIIKLVDKAQKEAGYSMKLADTLETLSCHLDKVQGEISEALSLPRFKKKESER